MPICEGSGWWRILLEIFWQTEIDYQTVTERLSAFAAGSPLNAAHFHTILSGSILSSPPTKSHIAPHARGAKSLTRTDLKSANGQSMQKLRYGDLTWHVCPFSGPCLLVLWFEAQSRPHVLRPICRLLPGESVWNADVAFLHKVLHHRICAGI